LIASNTILRLRRARAQARLQIAKMVPHESDDIAAGLGPP
jgi:hypothetical protein